jgi:hypothetical protein
MIQGWIIVNPEIIPKPINNQFFHSDLADTGTRERLQRSEQYLTDSQSFSHFFRQLNNKPQVTHNLLGRSDFLRIFIFILSKKMPSQYCMPSACATRTSACSKAERACAAV